MKNTLDKPKNMENYNDLNSNKKFRVIFVCHGNICSCKPNCGFMLFYVNRSVNRLRE